jgi:hypothetical protein
MCGERMGGVGVACTCWEVASGDGGGVGGALRRAAWGVGRRARRRCEAIRARFGAQIARRCQEIHYSYTQNS